MKPDIQILLIEDDQDDVDLFRYALSKDNVAYRLNVIMEGDQVAPYLDGSEPLPDVIVMDLNLPKVHGRDVIRQIKAADRFSPIPLLVLTTSSSREDRAFCLAMGADDFITKPTDLNAFKAIIATLTELASVHR